MFNILSFACNRLCSLLDEVKIERLQGRAASKMPSGTYCNTIKFALHLYLTLLILYESRVILSYC